MSNVSRFSVFGAGLACGVLVLVACSSPAPLDDEGSGGSASTAPSGKTPSKPTPDDPKNPKPIPGDNPNTDGGTTTPTGDQACAATVGEDACTTCCETNHAAGSQVYDDAFDACVCTEGAAVGKCQTECAKTYCSDDGPDEVDGDACDVCLTKADPDEGTGPCTAPIQAACNGSPDCVALLKCYDTCP